MQDVLIPGPRVPAQPRHVSAWVKGVPGTDGSMQDTDPFHRELASLYDAPHH